MNREYTGDIYTCYNLLENIDNKKTGDRRCIG